MICKKVFSANANEYYDSSHYSNVIKEDMLGLKEDGSVLFYLKKGAINGDYSKVLIKRGRSKTKNRGSAAGVCDINRFPKNADYLIDPKTKEKLKEDHKYVSVAYIDKKGKECKRCQSNTTRGACAGYFDRVGGLPCRMVGWSRDNLEKHKSLLPMCEEIDKVYKEGAIEDYNNQKMRANMSSAYLLGDSIFSTLTINYDFRTACHKDKGDFKEGLSTLTIFEETPDNYEGFYLGLPEYKIAFDLRNNDVLVFDAHEYHCNTEYKVLSDKLPIDDLTGNHFAGRCAVVAYLRNRLYKCPIQTHTSQYKIAIPSYNRPDILRKKTLTFLKDTPQKDIYIFLHNEEQKELYFKDFQSAETGVSFGDYNVIVMNNECSIKNSRNYMKDYFNEGEQIVFVDDDIEYIIDKNRQPVDYNMVIKKGFEELDKNKLNLWGLYPISNNMFLKDTITKDLRFCIGCFCGVRLCKKSEDRSVNMVEDLEKTIQYYINDGGVIRMNMYAPKTHIYRIKGGITNGNLQQRKNQSKIDSEIIAEKYPQYCKLRSKKNGFWDITLKK